MDLRNRLFPYPIVGFGYDDYETTEFNTDIERNYVGNKLNIKVTMDINNSEIQKLINNDYLIYVIHIECPQTFYRNIFKTKDKQIEIEIDDSKISGKLEISTLLIANKDVYNYSNYDLNEDYKGISFSFDKGNILGIGKQIKLDVNKNKEELGKIPSIFSIIMKKGDDKDFSVNINDDKIKVLLCEKDYYSFKKISNVKKFQGVIHSMIALPSLIFVFQEMKYGGIEDYEDYRWFKGLKRSLENYKIPLNKETLNKYETIKLSQLVLDAPISRGLISLSIDEFEEED